MLATAADDLSELDVLALTLHHEASGEGALGMVAVGCVIRNRADWGVWGHSMREVCLAVARTKKGKVVAQFSCWLPGGGRTNHNKLLNNVDVLKTGKRPKKMADAYETAYAILGEQPDITVGADHYYNPAGMDPPGRVPTWAANLTPTAHIGQHIFFRLRADT